MNGTTAGTNQKAHYNFNDLAALLDDPGHRPRTHEEVLAAEAAEPIRATTTAAGKDRSTFPLSALPPAIGNYIKEITANANVSIDMAVLPALSVLAICLQGKAVADSAMRNGHAEPLMLYTLTIAAPAMRKSSVLRKLRFPIDEYTEQLNENKRVKIEEYKAEKARLEQERNRNKDPNRSKGIAQEIAALKPEHEITMLISDATPESIADQMQRNGYKMGILDAEGGIFKTLGGQYASNGVTGNIDIIVKSYDGEPHTITRKTSDTVFLPRTALSMGLMIQPDIYDRFLQKSDFSANGFTQRFLVSFPEKLDRKFYTPAISDKAKRDYNTVIRRLLEMPTPAEKPIILANQKAAGLFQDYFWHLGKLEKEFSGSISEQWIDKQYGRCIRIAGLLHMVEHEATEQLDEKTAYSAIQIAKWTEMQYLHSTQEIIVDPVIETAKQLYSKIIKFMKEEVKKGNKKFEYFTLTDAKRCIRPEADPTGTKEKIFNSALDTLIDAGIVEEIESQNPRGRKGTWYKMTADHARIMKALK